MNFVQQGFLSSDGLLRRKKGIKVKTQRAKKADCVRKAVGKHCLDCEFRAGNGFNNVHGAIRHYPFLLSHSIYDHVKIIDIYDRFVNGILLR